MSQDLTPRKESEKSTLEKSKPHHIGKHTKETITQELFSLYNTKRMFRDTKWEVRNRAIKAEFEKFSIKEQEVIEARVKEMLNPK